MFSYAMEYLSDGFNLPSVLLAALVITGLLLITGRFHRLFRVLLVCFLLMSFPAVPKWLFTPLDIGVHNVDFSALDDVDAFVVLTDGVRTERASDYSALSNSTEIRLSHALNLARYDQIPLFVSITDEAEQELVKEFVGEEAPLIVFGPSATTRAHITNVIETARPLGVNSVVLFTTGSHAYRQRALLQSNGLEVLHVRVGVKDGSIDFRDFLPSFKGYLYWQLMLKEYWALIYYDLTNEL